jgi:hypothetical protein
MAKGTRRLLHWRIIESCPKLWTLCCQSPLPQRALDLLVGSIYPLPRYHALTLCYRLGPILGSLVASGFFWFIKSCEYQTANPGQDFDDLEASAYNPEEDLTRPVVSPTAVIPERATSPGFPRVSKEERSENFQPARGNSNATNHTLGSNTNTTTLAGTVHDRTTLS